MAVKPTYEELEQRLRELELKVDRHEEIEKKLDQHIQILSSIKDTIVIITPDLRTIYANQAAKDVFGDRPEMFTEPCYRFFKNRETPCKNCPVLKAVRDEKPHKAVMKSYDKDGREMWRFNTAFPFYDSDGQVIAGIEIVTDYTPKKVAETALRESEERYRSLFDNMRNAVAIYEACMEGEDFKFVDFNKAGEKIEGVFKDALIGKSVSEVFPGVREFGLFEIFKRVWKTGKAEHHPIAMYKDDRIAGWRDNFVYKLPSGEIVAIYSDETDRKRAEEALAKSEERYRLIAESSGEDIWQLDLNGHVIYASPAVEKIFGYTPEEALQLEMRAFFPESELGNATEAFSRAVAGQKYQLLEFDGLRKDGSTVSVEVSVTPMVKDGSIIGVQGIARDVTNRKKMEIQLNEALSWYREVFDGSKDAIFITNEDAQFIAVNEAACRLSGFSKEELLDMRIPDLHEEADLGPIRKYHARIMAGEPITSETKILCKDGKTVDTEFSNKTISILNKTYMHTTGRDITKRKRIEDEIRHLNERFSLAVDSAGIGVWDLDLEKDILVWDDWMYRLYGVDSETFEVSYEAWKKRHHPDDLPRVEEEVQRAVRGEKPFDTQFRIIQPDGQIRNIKAFARVVRNEKGIPIKMTGINFDITQQKAAEDALRKSEAEKHAILDASIDMIMLVDTELKIVWANKTAAETVNKRPQDLIGHTCHEIFQNSDQPCVGCPTIEAIKSGEPTFKTIHQPAMSVVGESYWEAYCVPIKDTSGHFVRAVEIARNITDRKKDEEALRESEAKFRTLVDQAPLSLLLFSIDGHIIDVNHTTLNSYGYTREELLMMKAGDIDPDLIQPEDDGGFWEKLQKHKPLSFDARHVRKDGSIFPVTVKISPILLGGNRHILALSMDMSEYKRAEEAIRKSEEEHRSIIKTAMDGFWLVDHTGRLTEVNEKYCEMSQYSEEELLSMHISDLEALESADDIAVRLKKTTEMGEARFETKHRRRDGTLFDVEVSVQYSVTDGGRFIAFLRDITQQKRLESELQQAQKMESLGNLAGGIAHDFNNILSPIMVHTEMALMELPDESLVRNNMEQIYRAGERARDLVQQILAFARKQEGERVEIKASLIVKEVIKFLRSTIPTTIDIQYEINAPQDIVFADPTHLNQIIMNLCTNAAHAMEKTGGLLEVILENENVDSDSAQLLANLEPGSYVKLSVKDTGHGIEPSLLDKIFEPYFTTKEVGKGTGMGLALVHGIVKSYRGEITVESEVGRGTNFHIYLPLVESGANAFGASIGSRQIPKGNERILFVDDEKSAVDAIQPILEKLGYKVMAKTNSVDALEAFRHNPDEFDIVITDMTMPNMTGKQLAREIMSIKSDMPIILCTGYSEQIDEKRAKEMGIRGFVLKPIVMREMVNKIREALDGK